MENGLKNKNGNRKTTEDATEIVQADMMVIWTRVITLEIKRYG